MSNRVGAMKVSMGVSVVNWAESRQEGANSTDQIALVD